MVSVQLRAEALRLLAQSNVPARWHDDIAEGRDLAYASRIVLPWEGDAGSLAAVADNAAKAVARGRLDLLAYHLGLQVGSLREAPSGVATEVAESASALADRAKAAVAGAGEAGRTALTVAAVAAGALAVLAVVVAVRGVTR